MRVRDIWMRVRDILRKMTYESKVSCDSTLRISHESKVSCDYKDPIKI